MEAETLEKTTSGFHWYHGKIPYVDNWFLMSSPLTILAILFSYLLFVLKIGPAIMKERPAFKLRTALLWYNAAQVIYSVYITYYICGLIANYGILESKTVCLIEAEGSQFAIAHGVHMYFLGKMSEMLDTIFFVLRKKDNQVSFLHVYHHSLTFTGSWVLLKYFPCYTGVFFGLLNSIVHVIMYTYYGLAAYPRLRPYLWWKKYITKMQLAQFGLTFIMVTINYFRTPCPVDRRMMTVGWAHIFLFIYLFAKFYRESYSEKTQKSSQNGTHSPKQNGENGAFKNEVRKTRVD